MKKIEPKKGTQAYMMLKNMRRKKGTTVREGYEFSNSPTKVISELREMGHQIQWEWEYKKDDKGRNVKWWKRYWAA